MLLEHPCHSYHGGHSHISHKLRRGPFHTPPPLPLCQLRPLGHLHVSVMNPVSRLLRQSSPSPLQLLLKLNQTRTLRLSSVAKSGRGTNAFQTLPLSTPPNCQPRFLLVVRPRHLVFQ